MEGATEKHGGREARHHRGGLDIMKITKHFVGPPSAIQSDAVAVNPGTEESHSAARAGGANRDVGISIRWIRMQVERGPNVAGKVGRQDVTDLTRSGNDSTQRGRGIGEAVRAKSEDSEGETVNGVQQMGMP
jgi:hypothetical protein